VAHTPIPLGILPAGTANVLAAEMGLPAGLPEAARALLECRPRRISLGIVRSTAQAPRLFLLMAGAGLDARIVYKLSPPLKARLGKIAYWVAAQTLARGPLDEFTVHAGGRIHRASFALLSKVRNYGGDFHIAQRVNLLDDTFEVVLFAGRNPLRYVKYLAGAALGRVNGMRGVTILRDSRISLEAPAGRRVYLQVDGELAGSLPATVEILPDALTLLVPPAYSS
jgi:diacylglycerol kinase (ATP)